MKKTLMSIVFGVLAMVLMIGGAKAAGTCTDNCEAYVTNSANEASNGGYASISDAWTQVTTNGGTIELKKEIYPGAATISKDVTIEAGDYDFVAQGDLTVQNGATLTINGSSINMGAHKFDVAKGGKLVIDGVITTTATDLIETAGTVEISANSEITATTKNVVLAKANADVTLNGTYNAATIVTSDTTAARYGESVAQVTIAGGTYNASAKAIDAKTGMVLTISGGEITATNQVVLINDAKVTIEGGNLVSTDDNAVQTNGTDENASLTINGGTIISAASGKTALYFMNANAKYALTNGTIESKGAKDAAAINLDSAFFDATTGKLIASQEGIITGGKYLNKIVALVENPLTHATMDISTQLVAEGVAITTVDGYKVVGEGEKTTEPGTEGENNGEVTAPESQGNTADAKNPNTSDNVYGLISMAVASVAGLFVTFKKTILG